ncbi:MAG: SurA N-terminal domain-containing protein [Bdellovibrio sp.]|nr:SurA N-terminal domain-containing protein [Bdellovibrio sp.]
MLSWIREKFGTVVIGSIIALIALVFIFYGVFSPKSTRGLHEGAVAGTVNGDAITLSEFSRELNRRMEFYKSISGGAQLTDEQMKQFRLREGVFQELVNRKLMIQEAKRQGLTAADDDVKDRIQEIPAFRKEGQFDVTTYRSILEANNMTPGGFEKSVREDLSVQQWADFFKNRVHVSEVEIKREFQLTHDKRNLRFVLVTPEAVKGGISVTPEEIKKFLADPAQANVVQAKYEAGKGTLYKGVKLEDAKERIAKSILAENKTDEVQKKVEALAGQVLDLMSKNASAPEAKLNALLKTHGLTTKTTGWINRKGSYVPGFGESKDLMAAVFDPNAPLDIKKGGHPKKFQSANRFLVAWVAESEVADLSKIESDRQALVQQISQRKSMELYQGLMKRLLDKAKIDSNPAVIRSEG